MGFLGIGPGEILVIMVIALLILGPGKLPETARALGKAIKEFKKYSSSLTKDFKGEMEKELKTSNAPAGKNVVKSEERVMKAEASEAVASPGKDEVAS